MPHILKPLCERVCVFIIAVTELYVCKYSSLCFIKLLSVIGMMPIYKCLFQDIVFHFGD